MVRAAAAPAARPNSAVAAELGLALPWPRTTSSARRGQGGGGACDSRERRATSAPHLYVTGSASARSIRGPLRRRRRRPARRPAIPRRARRRPEPAALEGGHTWRSQVYPTAKAPELQGEQTAREARPRPRLRPAEAPGAQPSTSTRVVRAARGTASSRHFFPRPPTAAEPLRLPVRAAPAFSGSVTISQNPITSQSSPPPIGQRGG